jgi:hypothetical protein
VNGTCLVLFVMVYVMMLYVTNIAYCQMMGWFLNEKLDRVWKVVLIQKLSHCQLKHNTNLVVFLSAWSDIDLILVLVTTQWDDVCLNSVHPLIQSTFLALPGCTEENFCHYNWSPGHCLFKVSIIWTWCSVIGHTTY